jgi:sulfite dehydrogenase (quinone) subunit SoeC
MLLFTTLSGAGQGLFIALALLQAAGALGLVEALPLVFWLAGGGCVLVACGVGLVAASFHLGHPLRAWRAAAMWRTSWLSREVIVLPLFMASVAVWMAARVLGGSGDAWAILGSLLALVLYVCTGMIYAAVRAMREWATPLTPISFALLGLASGALACAALAALWRPALGGWLVQLAAGILMIGAAARWAQWRRGRALSEAGRLQAALGVRHPRIVQTSDGMTTGSFGSREFFHGQSEARLRQVQAAALGLGLLLPLLLLPPARAGGWVLLALLWALQWLGGLADRWLFFAEARHPQNLYMGGRR